MTNQHLKRCEVANKGTADELHTLYTAYTGEINKVAPAATPVNAGTQRYPDRPIPRFNPDDDEEWGIRWGYLYG